LKHSQKNHQKAYFTKEGKGTSFYSNAMGDKMAMKEGKGLEETEGEKE